MCFHWVLGLVRNRTVLVLYLLLGGRHNDSYHNLTILWNFFNFFLNSLSSLWARRTYYRVRDFSTLFDFSFTLLFIWLLPVLTSRGWSKTLFWVRTGRKGVLWAELLSATRWCPRRSQNLSQLQVRERLPDIASISCFLQDVPGTDGGWPIMSHMMNFCLLVFVAYYSWQSGYLADRGIWRRTGSC